jgi:two-component system copper resistance phosphate regulon response regulator CusR
MSGILQVCSGLWSLDFDALKVLVVEDEPKVADALREGLQAEQYDVAVERTGEGAFYRTATETFDLVLLDLSLPARDGLDVLAALRAQSIRVPVIVISARDRIEDRVTGLDAGADDYVVKPFAFAELLARMRSLLRRGHTSDSELTTAGSLTIDVIARRARRGSTPIELTTKEFELLEYIVRHQGEIVSRETLVREVWKEASRSGPLDNVIDVYIGRLRRKMDVDGLPPIIHTIRGVGYTLREGEG